MAPRKKKGGRPTRASVPDFSYGANVQQCVKKSFPYYKILGVLMFAVDGYNNRTLGEFCFAMIGRADIEGLG